MIYTSDNQVYEDATAHALDMPKDLSQRDVSTSQSQSRMPRQASTEPADALKSDLGTQVPDKTNFIEKGFLAAMRAGESLSYKLGVPDTALKLYNDVVQRGRKEPITEQDLEPEEQKQFRNMILKHSQKNNITEGNIDYKDYDKESSLSPNILGGFKYKIDPEGNIGIKDTYDFNVNRGSSWDENPWIQALSTLIAPAGLAASIGRKIVPDTSGKGIPVDIQLKKPLSEMQHEAKQLYIIRHGATDMNNESNVSTDRIRGWTDIPLNDEGRQDAEKAGQKLASMEAPTVMHHSDLDRATETAEIIGKHVDVPTTASRKLRPWDLGTLTGKSTKEAIPEIEDYVRNKPDVAVPKGESFNEFKQRAFEGIHAALDSGDSPVAIVTHHRLERLLEAWDKKGQPADHSIDLDTFVQKGDPPGGIKTLKIAMNDNTPKGEMNLPNIAGGLSTPPKPANDNDSRKPFKANPTPEDKFPAYDEISKKIEEFEKSEALKKALQRKADWAATRKAQEDPGLTLGIELKNDLSSVKPSTDIEDRRNNPELEMAPDVTEEEGLRMYRDFLKHNDIDPNSEFANRLGSWSQIEKLVSQLKALSAVKRKYGSTK